MARPLSDDELQYIREFFQSPTAEALFAEMQDGLVNDWINTQDLTSRELIWSDLQALLRLKVSLRDAPAMKRLTQHTQAIYQT
jgi:hypothetical protein